MSKLTDPTNSNNLITVIVQQLIPERAEAYGVTTSITSTTTTNIDNIDPLLGGTQWLSNTVTFSFTNDFVNDYEDELGYSSSSVHAASFQTLNTTQCTVAREWFDMYESVSELNMVELTDASERDATIRIAESNDPSTAYAYYPGNSFEAGDVWFNTSYYNNPVIGNYAYHTFGHEFGHALGLKHGHEIGGISNVAMDANRDSMEFSIMTYRSYVGAPLNGYTNETWGYAQSLMMYDIRAIQQMYGANFNYNFDNTTYTFSTTSGEMFVNGIGQGTPGDNRIFRTIWDGNGNDTYDFSNYTTNLAINLEPGGWTNLDVGGNFQRAYLGDGNYARGHVFNALLFNDDMRSLIENAKGGLGNDSINGNSANNILCGNDGNDTVNGSSGDDYMDGGVGIDTVDYTYWGGGGTYNLANGVTFFPDLYDEDILNFENIFTGSGNDNVIGSAADNIIITDAGNDTVNGGFGNDTIAGGLGNDILTGNTGTDYFKFESFNEGIDQITDFFVSNDIINVSTVGFGGELVAGTFITSAQFVIGATANDEFNRFIYNSITGALSFDLDGSLESFAQVQVATLSAGLTMTNNDVFVIA